MRLLTIILTSLLMTACSSGSKKQFQKLYYRFPDPQSIELTKPILIKKPTALGIFANRPLVVVDSTGALKQMNYSFWLESPKVLLNNYLNKLFKSELSNSKQGHTLYTEILQFEKSQDIALVAINFKLISPKGSIDLDKTYEKQLQSNDKSVSQFVKSIGLMLQQITAELYEEALNDD